MSVGTIPQNFFSKKFRDFCIFCGHWAKSLGTSRGFCRTGFQRVHKIIFMKEFFFQILFLQFRTSTEKKSAFGKNLRQCCQCSKLQSQRNTLMNNSFLFETNSICLNLSFTVFFRPFLDKFSDGSGNNSLLARRKVCWKLYFSKKRHFFHHSRLVSKRKSAGFSKLYSTRP